MNIRRFRIDTLLFQSCIVTTDYFSRGGNNQVVTELYCHNAFPNVIKIDHIRDDDSVETIYTNTDLSVLIDGARKEVGYVPSRKDFENETISN